MGESEPMLPQRFASEEELEEFLSEPSKAARKDLAGLEGEFLVLGAGGKMGPTLCPLLQRATGRIVTAVSRFSAAGLRQRLQRARVRTVVADLLDRKAYEELPDAANLFSLAGMNFGASSQEELAWAMNVYVPAPVQGAHLSVLQRAQPTALLSDSRECFDVFGPPRGALEQMLHWITAPVAHGQRTLKKPTKFQVRDGRF